VLDGLSGAAGLARDALFGFVREFLWKELHEGAISLRDLSPAMRTVVALSTLMLVVGTISFAAGDVLRTGQALIVMPNGTAGRGSLVPAPLVPATFAALALGCALLLAGALHAPPAVRLTVLALYATLALAFAGLGVALEGTSRIPGWPALVLILAVLVTYLARWRAAPRPAPEFALLLVLAAGTLAFSAAAVFRSDAITGSRFALQQLDLLLGLLVGLSLPLVVVAGLDAVGFGLDAAHWAVGFIAERLSPRAVYLGLVVIVAWRSYDLTRLVGEALADQAVGDLALQILGAAMLVMAMLGLWLTLARIGARAAAPGEDGVDHSSARVRLPLGIAYGGLTFLLVPVLLVLDALSSMGGAANATVFEAVDSFASFLGQDQTVTVYRILLGVVLLGVAAQLSRRGSTTLALFVGAVGVNDVLTHVFAGIDALDPLLWHSAVPLDVAWNATFLAAALWWTLRGALTLARAERVFFLVLLGAVLNHFDVFADPLAPILGFAGIGFVVFGLVWGFLTGGGWANQDSAAFPRSGRIFLYLGYSLLSVAVLNWFSVTHDMDELSGLESIGQNGVALLGYPLLYALFVVFLSGAVSNQAMARKDAPGEPAPEKAGEPRSA
jgi:hypothetical protein